MLYYTVLLLAGLLSAATAIAAIGPQGAAIPARNLTVITKNEAFPIIGPIVVTRCQTEDCSEG